MFRRGNRRIILYTKAACKNAGGFFYSKEREKIKKYSIIYADPPWQYQRSKVQGAAENHYPTIGIDELCALPVADLAAPDSALFLWATFPQLPEALRLIEAWGFRYKSVAFVWLKKNKKADSWFYGLGFWRRGNAEICLLATKGHPKRKAANIHQFISSPIEAHSKKPDEAREKIVALMGDLPRVELFARQAAAVGIPSYLLARGSIGNTGAMFLMLAVMLPAFLLAMYEKDGLPAEMVLKNIIRARFLRPGVRPYQTQNIYAPFAGRGMQAPRRALHKDRGI